MNGCQGCVASFKNESNGVLLSYFKEKKPFGRKLNGFWGNFRERLGI
jgi:hypothetical protein